MGQNGPGVKWILLARKCFLNIHITRFLCLLHCHRYAGHHRPRLPRVENFEKMALRARHLFKSRVQITEDAEDFGDRARHLHLARVMMVISIFVVLHLTLIPNGYTAFSYRLVFTINFSRRRGFP